MTIVPGRVNGTAGMAFYVGCLGGSDLLGFFNVFVPDVFPLLLQERVEVQRRKRSEKSGGRTPLFQLSQNFEMPMSKPTPKANAPAKIVETYTPARRRRTTV